LLLLFLSNGSSKRIQNHDFEKLPWKNQIILGFSENVNDPDLRLLKQEMDKNLCGINYRNLLHIHFTELQLQK